MLGKQNKQTPNQNQPSKQTKKMTSLSVKHQSKRMSSQISFCPVLMTIWLEWDLENTDNWDSENGLLKTVTSYA